MTSSMDNSLESYQDLVRRMAATLGESRQFINRCILPHEKGCDNWASRLGTKIDVALDKVRAAIPQHQPPLENALELLESINYEIGYLNGKGLEAEKAQIKTREQLRGIIAKALES